MFQKGALVVGLVDSVAVSAFLATPSYLNVPKSIDVSKGIEHDAPTGQHSHPCPEAAFWEAWPWRSWFRLLRVGHIGLYGRGYSGGGYSGEIEPGEFETQESG